MSNQLIYVCNHCAHMWQDNFEGVQRCEKLPCGNTQENIYTFEVYAADYAADWAQRCLEAIS